METHIASWEGFHVVLFQRIFYCATAAFAARLLLKGSYKWHSMRLSLCGPVNQLATVCYVLRELHACDMHNWESKLKSEKYCKMFQKQSCTIPGSFSLRCDMSIQNRTMQISTKIARIVHKKRCTRKDFQGYTSRERNWPCNWKTISWQPFLACWPSMCGASFLSSTGNKVS